MNNDTIDGRRRSLQSANLPWAYKAVVHAASLFVPAILFTLFLFRGTSSPPDFSVALGTTFLVMSLVYTSLLYAIAGGFDWQPGSIGIGRTLLYALLGGVMFAIPLFILWVIVRVLGAAAFRLPIGSAAGKIWITGAGSTT